MERWCGEEGVRVAWRGEILRSEKCEDVELGEGMVVRLRGGRALMRELSSAKRSLLCGCWGGDTGREAESRLGVWEMELGGSSAICELRVELEGVSVGVCVLWISGWRLLVCSPLTEGVLGSSGAFGLGESLILMEFSSCRSVQ